MQSRNLSSEVRVPTLWGKIPEKSESKVYVRTGFKQEFII